MATIPTISDIYQALSNDLKNRLNLNDSDLKTVLDAVSLSLAGQFKLTYLYLKDVQEQLYADTADTAENGGTLDRQGLIYLNRIRRPATSGLFNVQIIGENGSVLRSGITFKADDNSSAPGKLFVLDAEETMAGVLINDVIEIRSLGGGGDYLLTVGDTLTITEPVIGVNKSVTVTSVSELPLSEELVEDYRQAILQSLQLEPQGGAKTDYRIWAADAQGVRKVYPYLKAGDAGTVQVYVEAAIADSIDSLGTPGAALLQDVEDVINLDPDDTISLNDRGRRPIQANLEVIAINIVPVDVTITGIQQTSAEIEASLKTNYEAFLYQIRPFVDGADLNRDKNDILYAAQIQSITTDVLDSSNFFSSLDLFVDGNAVTSFIFDRENIPYLRTLIVNT